jgi:nitrogen fixation/metabolism regulation signal transduction histidine kinase
MKNKMITVFLQANEEEIKISVEDNGPGFSETLLKSVKQAYVTTKSKGTGLGLAIVDKIVSDHFGQLNITNNNSGGGKVELIINTNILKNKLKL